MTAVLPTRSGAYRWYYFDVSAGDYTAVVIFMVGSLFSPRYARGVRKGASPQAHSAVNFALYEKGEPKQWVLTEYQQVSLEDDAKTLRIGGSSVRWNVDGSISVSVVDRTPLWGKPAQIELHVVPEARGHEAFQLVDGLPHWWQPYAPRASAKVSLPLHGLELEGRGYHDGNHGETPLGTDLRGWDWLRTHDAHSTRVVYRPWHDGVTPLHVETKAGSVQHSRAETTKVETTKTKWALSVPSRMSLLESSPFYARLESGSAESHSICEVADFKRFRSPLISWMAHFRTRVEASP